MLKRYRKRFVAFTTLLVGTVLLIALVVQGAYIFQNSYRTMRNTMRTVLEPWDETGDSAALHELIGRRGQGPHDGAVPEVEPPFEHRSDLRMAEADFQQVLTLIYRPESGELDVLSREPVPDTETLRAQAAEAAAAAEDFGRLSDGTYYYREGSAEVCKIALTDALYLRTTLTKSVLMLCAVFVGSMALILLVSVLLSRRAAKPMEDAVALERQFIADISHDLKTPITVVLANTSILKSCPEAAAAEREQWLDSTEDASRSMMHMVDEMLTLSELEAPDRKLTLLPTDLSAAAEKAVLQLEPLAYERGVTLRSEIAEGAVVPAASDYLQRICSSLLENAIKYEPDGGQVELTLTAVRKKATLTVRNTSSVIAPEDLPHVFERFYRGDKARNAQGGHGLGLSIVREITEKLGGRITAESAPETGTAFTVSFDTAE